MTCPPTVREILEVFDATMSESAARLAERTGLPVAEARAMLEADPRAVELRNRYVLQAVTVEAAPAPGVH